MTNNPFENAQAQLQKITQYLKITPSQLAVLSVPQRILEVNLPIKLDNGQIKIFRGYRSQHHNALGPYKGGIRYHSGVTKEEVMALSMWMSWKCAIVGLPYGGAKGGVIVNPAELSRGELKRLSQAYAKAISPIIGPHLDIPAPDVNTDSQIMDWMAAAIGDKATFTGKSVKNGGSLGREEATGFGGLIILNQILKLLRINIEQLTIVVQGFGNVGFNFAQLAHQAGFKIIALSDSKGGIYNPAGLDPKKVMIFKNKTGSVVGFPDSQLITNDQLLIVPGDVLVPAALENIITSQNAAKIKAKIVLEMANGPTTPEADKILWRQKVQLIPDVLANSGGVIVSYFEWCQNLSQQRWSKEKVNQKLEKKIISAVNQVWQTGQKYRVDLRTAAYILGVDKIIKADEKNRR